MNHLEAIDLHIENWLKKIKNPNDEQVKILAKLRDTYSGINKKKIDIRLRSKTDEELLRLVIDGTNT